MPQLKPTRGIRLNKSHPLARGLVGCWPFNEGSGGQVSDLSGNGNGGTFQGTAPSWSASKFGPAVDLPGTDERVEVADSPELDGFSSFTILSKIFLRDAGGVTGSTIAYKWNDFGGSKLSWAFRVMETRYLRGGFRDSVDTNHFLSDDTTQLNLNQHYEVGFVYDGQYLRLFLDGVQVKSSSIGSFTVNSSAAPVHIGAQHAVGGGWFNALNGLIDYVMIWNRSLSSSEIALLYREPFYMFERAWIPKLIGGQIVELAGSSVALSSSSATAKAMRKVGGNVVSTTDVTAILNLIRSLLYIESNWKREALFNGMTANAFKLGTTLSLGWFWVRVAGCSVLYRGSSMEEIDFVNILTVAEQDACEISPPNYISHYSDSTYFYVVRRFNNCGYQECTLAASVKVSIESNGELAEPQPNKVFDSEAELVNGNKIQLVWYYCPLEQKSQPTCFNVYYDGRTGQIDYENPLAIIGYKGRKFYSYQCGALEAGRYLFAIRTEDVSGIENSSLARLRIQFDPTNPDAIDILSVEGV